MITDNERVFNRIRSYYVNHLWSKKRVENMRNQGIITEDQYNEIINTNDEEGE